MLKVLLFALLLISTLPCIAAAQEVDTKIIQTRQGRIYFDSGRESAISSGAQFKILCDSLMVTEGIIEYSGPGISFSHPLGGMDTLQFDDDCFGRVTVAAVDSGALITIGTDLPLRLFDPVHEPLFLRDGDSVRSDIIDSTALFGNRLELYLNRDIRFSDGSRLDAQTLAWCLDDLRANSRSYLTRYFFSKLLPADSGGIVVGDAFSIRLTFYHRLPYANYYLTHPDFSIYNQDRLGTGPLVQTGGDNFAGSQKRYAANSFYHRPAPVMKELVIQHFRQSYRMKFAFDENLIDGYIGFGFNDILAGQYRTQALYPNTIAMIAGVGGAVFSEAMFATSLYYRFDPSRSHLYFPDGETKAINRWLLSSSFSRRHYSFDHLKGSKLQRNVTVPAQPMHMVYDDPLLSKMSDYFADMAAREGMRTVIDDKRTGFDIRIAELPSSDSIMPFGLIAVVLELNDQNALLPPGRKMNQSGWYEIDRGSRLERAESRNNFFEDAEEIVVEEYGAFPLFRPVIFIVTDDNLKNLRFDFYGYPKLSGAVKYQTGQTGDKR